MKFQCYILWIFLEFAAAIYENEERAEESKTQISRTIAWAEPGFVARLPCNVTPGFQDKINMILWYKDGTGIPIYSLDARGKKMSEAIHLSTALNDRFQLAGGDLKISQVGTDDAGLYRCRIDFENSPTRLFEVFLHLVDLPTVPVMTTRENSQISDVLGPFREGDTMEVICVVNGGHPTPTLSWWIEQKEYHGRVERTPETVSSRLILRISGNVRGKTLICRANVTGATSDLSVGTQLRIYAKPDQVRMLSGFQNARAGKSQQIVCECRGSDPPASISWSLDGKPIRNAATLVTHNFNVTKSVLTFQPERWEDGKEATCSCNNPEFPDFSLEDKKALNVAHAPVVELFPWNRVIYHQGENVSLNCSAQANPPVQTFIWYRNDTMLQANGSRNLGIQDVNSTISGKYVCEAVNVEGSGKSSPESITVVDRPTCTKGHESHTIYASEMETLILHCRVDSLGSEATFSWTFQYENATFSGRGGRDSPDSEENLPESTGDLSSPDTTDSAIGHSSILKYTPAEDGHFGTLFCSAKNDAGIQRTPCAFHVRLAKKPEPPENCTVSAKKDLLKVSCLPGYDWGLKSYYLLEIRPLEVAGEEYSNGSDHNVGQMLFAPIDCLKGETPSFEVFNLLPGESYTFTIYAVNVKGRSSPVILYRQLSTKIGDKILSSEMNSKEGAVMWPAFYLGIAVALGLLIVSLVVLTGFVIACRNNEGNSNAVSVECDDWDANNFRIIYSPIPLDKRDYEANF